MGRVIYPLQQPDTNMDGVSLDSFLTDMQTETASLDAVNFRDRGFDQRAAADNLVAELLFTPIVHKARTAQTMTAGTAVLLNPGTSFETADVALEQYDIVELEASLYVSADLAGVEEGRLAGDRVRVRIQASTNSGGAWSDLPGSRRGMGATATPIPGQYGSNEPEGHHGSMHPFALYTVALGGAIASVRFRVVVECNNANDVYFEDCSFYAVKLRRA